VGGGTNRTPSHPERSVYHLRPRSFTVDEFFAKLLGSKGSERANKGSFFRNLHALLGMASPGSQLETCNDATAFKRPL
jgi:hypothetical protein